MRRMYMKILRTPKYIVNAKDEKLISNPNCIVSNQNITYIRGSRNHKKLNTKTMKKRRIQRSTNMQKK